MSLDKFIGPAVYLGAGLDTKPTTLLPIKEFVFVDMLPHDFYAKSDESAIFFPTILTNMYRNGFVLAEKIKNQLIFANFSTKQTVKYFTNVFLSPTDLKSLPCLDDFTTLFVSKYDPPKQVLLILPKLNCIIIDSETTHHPKDNSLIHELQTNTKHYNKFIKFLTFDSTKDILIDKHPFEVESPMPA